MNAWTRAGIKAYRVGNLHQARRYFKLAVMENPEDIQAWLWSVELAESDAERQRCLEQILILDPDQVAAWSALASVKARARAQESSHVSPFVSEEPAADIPVPAAPGAPIQPAIAQPRAPVEDTAPTATGNSPEWFQQPWWCWGSIGLAVLVVLALIGWLAVNFVK